MNPHSENFLRAEARALSLERAYAERVSAADARYIKVKIITGWAALFAMTYLCLLYGQVMTFGWANVFATLALNVGLWAVGAIVTRRIK